MSATGHNDFAGGRRFMTGNKVDELNNQLSWYFCFGDCSQITDFLKVKQGKTWILPKFLNALLRGIGQVVFANNPFTGVIVLAAIFWYSSTAGILVTASASLAILTAVITHQDSDAISSGIILFNAVLLSSVTSLLWTPFFNEPLDSKIITFILGGSSFSVILSSGLSNILSSFKPSIPILSIPFHFLILATFTCLMPNSNLEPKELGEIKILNNSLLPGEVANLSNVLFENLDNTTAVEFYSWGTVQNIWQGVTLSSGQVFGMADIFCSLLVYAAMLMYSPILTLMCFQGALTATVSGFFLTQSPADDVFSGVYGFNGFLAGATVGLFYIFNCSSFVHATANAVLTAVFQRSITPYFSTNRLPVFGLPFLLSTLIFVCVTGKRLVRADKISFPEKQRKNYLKEQSQQRNDEETAARTSLMNA